MAHKLPWPGRLACAVATVLFCTSAYFQLNDPDPVLWVTAYLTAAALTAAASFGYRPPWRLTLVLGGLAAAGAAWLCWVVFFSGASTPMYPGHEPTGWLIVDTEQGREMGGLGIIASALLPLAWSSRPGAGKAQ